jgi:hypothetical protein
LKGGYEIKIDDGGAIFENEMILRNALDNQRIP